MISKRIFIISGSIFGLLLIIFLAWKFVFSSKFNTQNEVEIISSGFKTENNANQKIKKIIDGPVVGATLKKNIDQIIFYQNKKFFTTDFEGTAKNPIGGYPFNRPEKISWSPDQKQAIVLDGKDFYLYQLNKDQAEKIKDGLDNAVWDETGDKIVYKYYNQDTQERSLNIADPDGSNWKVIQPELTLKDLRVISLSSRREECFYPKPRAEISGQLDCVQLDKKNKIKTLYSGGYGASYLFSPKKNKILFSVTEQQGGNRSKIFVMNSAGEEIKNLNFPTLAEKCVWSATEEWIFCGMMNGVPKEAHLPDDWFDRRYDFADTFWKINVETGKKERLVENKEVKEVIDGKNFFLDKDERFLFLTNRLDDGLYRIKLK